MAGGTLTGGAPGGTHRAPAGPGGGAGQRLAPLRPRLRRRLRRLRGLAPPHPPLRPEPQPLCLPRGEVAILLLFALFEVDMAKLEVPLAAAALER